jgi:hypothetical protein
VGAVPGAGMASNPFPTLGKSHNVCIYVSAFWNGNNKISPAYKSWGRLDDSGLVVLILNAICVACQHVFISKYREKVENEKHVIKTLIIHHAAFFFKRMLRDHKSN